MSMVDTDSLPPEPPPDLSGAPWQPSVDLAALSRGGMPMPSAPPPAVTRGSMPLLPAGVDIDQLSREAAAIQYDKMAATARLDAENVALLAKDRARMEEQYNKSGIGPDDLKPFDAEAAREKYRYDPVEAFGSLGSVFAIVASAFTNRPMENAMYGAAAAMNAVKEGNAQEYERAYKTWQDNTKLAINRQKIQSEQFTNATSLFNTDMKLGTERARLLAAQYGDKQLALLLDNGLYKEAIELNDKRQSMAIKLAETLPKLAIENYKMSDLLSRADGAKPGSPEFQRAVQAWKQDWTGQKYDEDADFSRKWWDENPQGTSEQFGAAFGAFKEKTAVANRGAETPAKVALTKFLQANPDATPDEINAYIRNSKGPSDSKVDLESRKLSIAEARANEIIRHNEAVEAIQAGGGDTARLRAEETARHNRAMETITANRTTGGPKEQEITLRTKELMDADPSLSRTAANDRARRELTAANAVQTASRALVPSIDARTKELEAQGVPASQARAQATREVSTSAAAPSGNRIDDIKGMSDRVTLAESVIDKIDGLLLKHNAITGLGGVLTRPFEVVGNILGSDETDRVQFTRYVAELKEVLPRIITGSNARPLAAEVGNINRIAAGMSLGDTGANTVRAYAELRPLLAQIKQRLQERGAGLPGSAPVSIPATGGEPAWKSAPVKR